MGRDSQDVIFSEIMIKQPFPPVALWPPDHTALSKLSIIHPFFTPLTFSVNVLSFNRCVPISFECV